jgi:sigma-B regulation protein RsbU (phosphoserine phosphatase)
MNPQTGEVVYINAGHNPPFLFRANEKRFEMLARTGMVLGIDDHANFEKNSLFLFPGDFIFFYTDGVTDASNQKSEMFGYEKLESTLLKYNHLSAVNLLDSIEEDIQIFIGDAQPADDITMMFVKRV